MSKLTDHFKNDPELAAMIYGVVISGLMVSPIFVMAAKAEDTKVDTANQLAISQIEDLNAEYSTIARFVKHGKYEEALRITAAVKDKVTSTLAEVADTLPAMVITSALANLENAIINGSEAEIDESVETLKASLETDDFDMPSSMSF